VPDDETEFSPLVTAYSLPGPKSEAALGEGEDDGSEDPYCP
jgi:hypothetical protein